MKNKVVVVTGGSSGIGEALAYKFSNENFNVVISGTNVKRLKTVQSNILSKDEIEKLFDLNKILKNIKKVFKRLEIE